MKKLNISVTALALAGALTSLGAMAASGVGTINHDIKFGGIIAEDAPKWVWDLPKSTLRIDLKESDGVVDSNSNTKVWDILQNRQAYKFLEGYMEPTVVGVAAQGLNADVKYLQNGVEVTPTYDNANHATLLALKATGNQDSSPIDGQLALTLQPVLLLGQAANAGDKAIIVKQLANVGVTQASTNATEAYKNAQTKLSSQQAKIGAVDISYDNNSLWAAETLADGKQFNSPMIGGYASTMTAGKLSFPKNAAVHQWQSVVTVQVQYK